jgi:hypothetical protein
MKIRLISVIRVLCFISQWFRKVGGTRMSQMLPILTDKMLYCFINFRLKKIICENPLNQRHPCSMLYFPMLSCIFQGSASNLV